MAAQSTLRHSEDPIAVLYNHYAQLIRQRIKATSRTTRLLATLALLSSIIAGGVGGQRWWKKRRQEKEQGKRLLRRNSGLKGKDGSRTIFVPYKNSTSKVVIHPTKTTTFEAHRRLFLNPPRASGLPDSQSVPQMPPLQTKPGLNLAFLHQFLSLLSIMIPRWQSKETALLLSHGLFLALRTYLSLVVARLDGEIVRDLVAGHGKQFIWGILKVNYSMLSLSLVTTKLMFHVVVWNWSCCKLYELHVEIPPIKSSHWIPDTTYSIYPRFIPNSEPELLQTYELGWRCW
jgi:ATP-binding cassette subfamily D (ALD) long-chain fatty acid import protein